MILLAAVFAVIAALTFLGVVDFSTSGDMRWWNLPILAFMLSVAAVSSIASSACLMMWLS